MRRINDHPGKAWDWKYWLMDIHRVICLMIFAPMHRLKKIFVKEKYRLDGGGLMAMNHSAYSDGVIMFLTHWHRRVFYLVAEVAMDQKLIGALLHVIGCIKIDRNIADINTIHQCSDLLKNGHVLGIFPQGHIDRTGALEEGDIKLGTVLMAIQADVPIIPCYHMKRKNFFCRSKIVIGEPIYCRDYIAGTHATMKEMAAITDTLYARMDECRRIYWEREK